MNIKEFRSQYPQYKDMADADLAAALHAKSYSDVPFAEFAEAFGVKEPVTTVADYGKGLMSGVAGIAEAAGKGFRFAARVATPDTPSYPELAAAGIDEQKFKATELEDAGKWLQSAGGEAAQSWVGWMTPAGQRASKNEIFTDDLSLGKTPWQSLGLQAAMSLPSMAAMIPIGGPATKVITELGGTALASLAAKPGTVGFLARVLPSSAGYGGAEGAIAAMQNSAQTEREILDTPIETLEKHPNFQRLLHETDPALPLDKRQSLAREATARLASDEVAWKTFISTGGIGALTGGGAVGMVARGGKGGILKSTLKGMGEEALQEAPQSGAEQYIQNVAERAYVNPDKNVTEGVISAAASGGAVGGLTGGVFGAGGGIINRFTDPATAKPPGTEPGPADVTAPAQPVLAAASVDEAIDAAGKVLSTPVARTLEEQLAGISQDAARATQENAMYEGTAPNTPPIGTVGLAFQQAQERAQQAEQKRLAREAADAERAQADAATAAEQAKLPQSQELPILERVIKRQPVTEAEQAIVVDKGFARMRADGTLGITEQGYKARQALRRQANPASSQPQATPAGLINTPPKTVAGTPVDAHTDEQLQAIAQNPDTPATTRHAAVAAIQARTAAQTNPLTAQPVEQISPEPVVGSGGRWTADRGAMPGEPILYLDASANNAIRDLIKEETPPKRLKLGDTVFTDNYNGAGIRASGEIVSLSGGKPIVQVEVFRAPEGWTGENPTGKRVPMSEHWAAQKPEAATTPVTAQKIEPKAADAASVSADDFDALINEVQAERAQEAKPDAKAGPEERPPNPFKIDDIGKWVVPTPGGGWAGTKARYKLYTTPSWSESEQKWMVKLASGPTVNAADFQLEPAPKATIMGGAPPGGWLESDKVPEKYRKPQAEPVKAAAPERTVITPSEDVDIGKNAAGEQLYERPDGSVYRMQQGRPSFGGDLAPVNEAAKPTEPPAVEAKPDTSARPKDDDGNPIYKVGERVEFIGGPNEGLHGALSRADGITMRSFMLYGGGPVKSSTSYVYQVKTDNGAEVHASIGEFQLETAKPDKVVPDIKIGGQWIQPKSVYNQYQSYKRSANNQRARASRARIDKNKQAALKDAEQSDRNAEIYRKAFEFWATEHQAEAEAIRPTQGQAGAASTAPATTKGTATIPGMTVVESKHTKTGEKLWVVNMNKREDYAVFKAMEERAKEFGGWYNRSRAGLKGYTFKTEAQARQFMGQEAAPAKSTTPEIRGRDVQLPDSPYVYRKEPNGRWTWRVGFEADPVRANALPPDAIIIKEQLEPALAAETARNNPAAALLSGRDGVLPNVEQDLIPETEPSSLAGLSHIQLDKLAVEGNKNERELAAQERERRRQAPQPAAAEWQPVGNDMSPGAARALLQEGDRIRYQTFAGPIEGTVQPWQKGDGDNTRIKLDDDRVMVLDGRKLEYQATPAKTAGQIAGEAAEHAAKGVAEGFAGLDALFGRKGTLGSGPAFDEATWAKAKPHFEAAFAEFTAAGKSLKEFVKHILDSYNEAIIPYLKRWHKDLTEAQHAVSDREETAGNDTDRVEGHRPGDVRAPESESRTDEVRADEGISGDPAVQRGDEPGVTDRHTAGSVGAESGVFANSPGVDQSPEADRGQRAGASTGVPDGNAGGNYLAPVGGLARQGSWLETAKRNVQIIRLVKALEAEPRLATSQEQALISLYTGFGASEIANGLFPVKYEYKSGARGRYTKSATNEVDVDALKPGWKELYRELEGMLDAKELATLTRSTQYAHYTAEPIIRSIWNAVTAMGFTGGKILEPGMGTGLFMVAAPQNVATSSKYIGVEMDHMTASIAKQLLQKQNIIQDSYIDHNFPDNFFDMAIGNPPFAGWHVQADPRYRKQNFLLHDYFFAKTIDRVRPGGLLVFVTSAGTMNKLDDSAREYLADRSDLLGAIRLPQTAFKQSAGTEVVTDILFLKKREPGKQRGGEAWNKIDQVKVKDEDGQPTTVGVNEYFVKHPEMVLGRHAATGSMYSKNSYTVEPLEGNIEAHFAKAAENLPKDVYTQAAPKKTTTKIREETDRKDFDVKGHKEGGIYLAEDGEIMQVRSGAGVPLSSVMNLTDGDKAWLKSYVPLRDALKVAQLDQLQDGPWEQSQKALAKLYKAFVKQHGRILEHTIQERTKKDEDGEVTTANYKRFKRSKLLKSTVDVEITLAMGLEQINEDNNQVIDGDILSTRVLNKPGVPRIETVQDALAASLNDLGRFDLEAVSKLIGRDQDSVIKELGELIYEDPASGWQLGDEYLSGNVVRKLEEARAAAQTDSRFDRNVNALLNVQPKPLGPQDFEVRLGANWVPATDVQTFVSEVMEESIAITYDIRTNIWGVEGSTLRRDRISGAAWGSVDRSTAEILSNVLNNKDLTVRKTDADKKSYVDKDATAKVTDIAEKMRQAFQAWIWTDVDRAKRLLEDYNRRYNNLASREFDGSFLTLPGLSMRWKPYAHQLRAIWRIVQTGNTYMAHAVGAGKTMASIISAMEQKRLGLIRRPMFVVPNHMLEQFANEFMEFYPAAKILVADKENFIGDERRRFVAKASLGDWDAIIIKQSSFTLIGTEKSTREDLADDFLADLQSALEDTDKGDRTTRKRLEAQIEAFKQRMEKAGGGDANVTFEKMGVDFLYVDEAHTYRKLDYTTNNQIKGIDPAGSLRAFDMFVKLRYLDRLRLGRSVVMMSGTPITNTMAELYTVQRYMNYNGLVDAGLNHFDAWAQTFGAATTEWDRDAAGNYQAVTRFAKFVNLPELMMQVRDFMDVLTMEQLGEKVDRPIMKTGKPQMMTAQKSDALNEYMKGELAARLEASKKWKPSREEPGNPDPILNIITDGRLAAIDMRFVRPGNANDKGSKLNLMIDNIIADHEATKDKVFTDKDGTPDKLKGATQIVFSALGFGAQVAKTRGFDAKAWVLKRLNAAGIPKSEIAFMGDYTTDVQKEALFREMREGKKRILIGSPQNMGTGLNVQKRLASLHFLAPPWYPADVEQPHGRILRQGNQNTEADIRWYVTEGTYDSTQWGMVRRKGAMIEQAFRGDKSIRTIEDLSEVGMYAMAEAIASGDDRVIKLAGMKADIERYERLRNAHFGEQQSLKQKQFYSESSLKQARANLTEAEKALEALGEDYYSHKKVDIEINGKTYEKAGDAGQALIARMKSILTHNDEYRDARKTFNIGTIDGHTIEVAYSPGDSKYLPSLVVSVKVGPMVINVLSHENMTSMEALSDVGTAQKLRHALDAPDRQESQAKESIAENERILKQVNSRIGAPFEYANNLAQAIADAAQLEKDLTQADKQAAEELKGSLPTEEEKAAAALAERVDVVRYISRHGGAITVVNDFTDITLEGLDDIPMFVSKQGAEWVVTHTATGIRIKGAETKAGVIAAANQSVIDIGAQKYRDMIATKTPISLGDKEAALGTGPQFSRQSDLTFATEVITELSSVDELFRYPVSQRSSLEGVFKDVMPEVKYYGEHTRADEREESGADHRHVFTTNKGKTFYVHTTDNGRVWLDVSRLEAGEAGSAIYAAALNYAHNTRQRFVGDPMGVSDVAIIRRTNAMLSSALRFGTTRHMEAAPGQIRGVPEKGILPLDWGGDDVAKIRAMVDNVTSYLQKTFPDVNNARYDFQQQRFVDARTNEPLTETDFRKLVERGRDRASEIGSNTLKRGILLESLIRSEGSARPGLLEQTLRRSRELVTQGGLSGTFSRQTSPADAGLSVSDAVARQAVVDAFGEKATAGLEREGLLNFVNSPWDFPTEIHPQMRGNEEAVYWKGRSWIVKSAAPSDIVTRVLHEIGEHHGLESILGPDKYAKLQKRVALMNKSGNVAVREAWESVIKAEPDLQEGSERFIAEVIARVGQDQRVQTQTWWRQLLDAIKAFIIKHYSIPAGKITPEHIQALLRASVMAAAREQGKPAFLQGEAAAASRQARINVLLKSQGEGVDTIMEAERRLSNGDRVFVAHELDEEPREIRKVNELDGYAAEQVIVLSRFAEGRTRPDQTKAKKSLYIVTVTQKTPAWDDKPYTVEVYATSRSDANKRARRKLEVDGHVFTQSDQASFKSREATTDEVEKYNLGIRFSRGAGGLTAHMPGTVRDYSQKTADYLIYNYVDKFMDVRRMVKRAGNVPEAIDPSLKEEIYSGAVRARQDDFRDDMVNPLLKAIHDAKLKYEEVETYLHAKHAPSRNAAMREINPTAPELEAMRQDAEAVRDDLVDNESVQAYIRARRDLRDAQAEVEDGIADESAVERVQSNLATIQRVQEVRDYINAMDRLKALRNIKPFMGDNTALSGMSDTEAAAVLEKARQDGKAGDLEGISARIDAITAKTRRIFVGSGLEKAETIAAWEAKYEHYVPLHRDEVVDGVMPSTGRGFNIRGPESKRATGSEKEATHILAHVVAQHEAAIIRSEKSRVDKAFFDFALAYPDPSLYTVDQAEMLRVIDPVTGLAVERVNPMFKNKPNVLTFKIDGEEHTIEFNDRNPEALRMVAALKNMNAQDLGEVTIMVGKFTRLLATMNTSANPVFVARNLMRDLQTAYLNLSDTELAGMKKDVFSNVPNAIRGFWHMARGDVNSTWAKHAREFRDAGGQIGWMDNYKDIGERAQNLKAQLETMGEGKWNFTKREAKAWWSLIEDANMAVENGVRLAAYVAGRNSGLSKDKAAVLAKNLNVNFNRKGMKSTHLNMWYMFMNASIQGTARIVKAIGNKNVQKILGYVIASGFLMDILARALAGDGDDDGENDYDQLPEHTKANNFVFWVGRPITIPMPYGYNFFASVGRKMSETMFRKNYSPVKGAAELLNVFVDAFNPTGQSGSLLQFAAPTVADPFVQWTANKNFAGNPMRREQLPFGTPKPEYQMGFKSTSAPAKWLAEMLNNITGGNEVRPGWFNLNPAVIDFAITSVAGGAGRTYLQAFSLPIKAVQGEEIQSREVPFLNIIAGSKPEYQTERKFYEALRAVEVTKAELKHYANDPERVRQIRETRAEDIKMMGRAKYTEHVLQLLRKRERLLDKQDPENRKELEKQIEERKKALMNQFNKAYVEARQSAQ